jgi:hypothetical protein
MSNILGKKNADIPGIAGRALRDEKLLSELVANLKTKEETVRYNSSRALNLISVEHPVALYPKWDAFVDLLKSDHTYWILSAIPILANLTKVDSENKFEKIFKAYYGLLDHWSVIPAAWIAENSGMIARSKPRLRGKIVNRLLDIEATHHRSDRKDLIKSGIIKSFDELFQDIRQKVTVTEFVKNQLKCSSPKTRKAARVFLDKWGSGARRPKSALVKGSSRTGSGEKPAVHSKGE